MQVARYTVADYFNPDSQTKFFIPKYQREYVWGINEWEILFDDIETSANTHFLGSIICVNQQLDGMGPAQLELIDGQQRFTTISILLCAFHYRLSNLENVHEMAYTINHLRRRLLINNQNENPRFTPSEQSRNKNDLDYVFGLSLNIDAHPAPPPNFERRRIAKCFRYYVSRLDDFDNFENLQQFLRKLEQSTIIKIEVNTHADAFELFESINNRGIPLSPIDIIKNNLFSRLDNLIGYNVDEAFRSWVEMTNHLNDPIIQDRFLRHYYNVFYHVPNLVNDNNTQPAIKSNLIRLYSEVAQINTANLFSFIIRNGIEYSGFSNPQQWTPATTRALRDLNRLGASPSFALLLFTANMSEVNSWNKDTAILETTNYLIKWFFWRNLTNTPPSRNLDRIFILAMQNAFNSNSLVDFLYSVKETLRANKAEDAVIDAKLRGNIYTDNPLIVKFLLYIIEKHHFTDENHRDLWATNNNGRSVFTIEHVVPQNENLSQGWREMLKIEQHQHVQELHENYIHRIGNLTLSGYNANLGDADFAVKRDRTNDQGHYIGYRNGLYINHQIANSHEWNQNSINDRTNSIIKELQCILNLND